ncbi:type 1 fimbrial protein [Pseudomonas carnis]|uniref:fimbrial protein n=1 Tax=Pseudomonas carnis TaxID=2487355 RepID=UPI001CA79FBC|nr:fimbrial protein [Pseudomonas carnis]MBY8953688.1 type 1 fimbrial protein [Pseudomonas carnis]
MTPSIKCKNLQHLGIFIILIIYSSFGSATSCKTDNVYIKPTASEFQFAANAAGKGGMLSSAWHEFAQPLSCTEMSTNSNATFKYRYFMKAVYAGSSIQFEGQSYLLWSTSDPDIFMIGSIANSTGNYSPLTNSDYHTNYVDIPKADSNGNIHETIRVRIRYFSKNLNLKAGLKTLTDLQLLASHFTGDNLYPCTGGCYWGTPSIFISPVSFNVNSISCTLDAPALVKLRSIDTSSLPSGGATVEVASFQLGVSCNKSLAAYSVYYSMTDVNTPSNTSSNLTLAPLPDQASGVGLKVLDDGQPVSFGLKGSLKPIGTMAITGGIQKKMLSVGYVRGNEIVRPGKVNAGVTVTLAYE